MMEAHPIRKALARRSLEYMEHVIAVHGGQWRMTSYESGKVDAQYERGEQMMTFTCLNDEDALICIGFGVHSILGKGRECVYPLISFLAEEANAAG